MLLNDLDPQFLKSVNYLYASDKILKGDPVPLQYYLEEAIKNKCGVTKDLSVVVSASFKQRRVDEFKAFINQPMEETKCSSSDNELELDLFKEDLMCIVCNGMDVGARNRLIECTECRTLYHQECHKPIVGLQDSYETWICQKCKDSAKKIKTNSPVSTSVTSSTTSESSGGASQGKVSSSFKSSSSTSHRHSSSSSSSSSYKSLSKGDKYSKSNSSSKSSKSSSTSSRSNVTPNINIISADKRIQIMKKKAAKLQEKRKHLPH